MKPTARDLINIRNEKHCTLFQALIEFAKSLEDYTQYSGPYASEVIKSIELDRNSELDAQTQCDRVTDLRAQGLSPREIIDKMKREKNLKEGQVKSGGIIKFLDKAGKYVDDIPLQDHLNLQAVFEDIENFCIMKKWVK